MRLIDTHCHVDLYSDYEAVLAESEHAGIYTIAMTNTPSVFRRCADMTRGTRFVRAALGLHPELAAARERELLLLDELLPATRYIGEIGLDYVTEDTEDRAAQRRVFNAILSRCAISGDKVLSIHSRRAAADVTAMIGTSYPGTVILHWFSGPGAVLDRAVMQGCYFSVNPAMLNSVAGRRILSAIPSERILTETDGPFVLVRGHPARPTDIAQVIAQIARHWEIDIATVARRIEDNFRRALARAPTH